MYNTYVSSTVSVKCKGCAAFSSYGNPYCTKDRFNKYPLYNSSSSCCFCCANSMCRVPLGPCYVYGLRQSTLIQWSPCKKVFLSSLDSTSNKNSSSLGFERKCSYKKSCSFNEVSVRGGRGRLRSLGFQDNSERDSFSDVGVAEVLLSLLTKSVDEDFDDLRARKKSSWKNRVLEIEESGNVEKNCIHKKKGSRESSVVRKSKWEAESEEEEDNKTRKERRREKGKGALLRTEQEAVGGKLVRPRAREEDKDVLLSSERQKATSVLKDEKEYLSRNEDFSKKNHEKVKKEGSSCSSYYSASSTGELESDHEVRIEQEQNQRHSRNEIGEKVRRFEDQSKEQGAILRKDDAFGKPFVAPLADIEPINWRKKSEKRLGETSIEEKELRKESSHKQSRILGVDEIDYRKELISSYKTYDDKKRQPTSAEQAIEQSEIQIKHKKVLDPAVNATGPTEPLNQMMKSRDGSGKYSLKICEPQFQEVDLRGKLAKERVSSIIKKNGETSSNILDKQHNQAQELAIQVTRDEHRTYISERQSNMEFKDQKKYKSSLQLSTLESGKSSQTSAQLAEGTTSMHGKDPLVACGNDATNFNGNNTNTQVSQAHSSSQLSNSPKFESLSGSSRPMEQSSARPYQIQQEPCGEVKRDEVDAKLLEEVVSLKHGLGEFDEKVRCEVTSSETQGVKRLSRETKLIHEGEQNEQREPQLQENDSECSSLANQPSSSIQETSKTEIKRSGQSLWHIIGDIVRLRWISHSGFGRRSSSHQSTTSSETWIAGHVPEGNNGLKPENILQQKSSSDHLKRKDIQVQGDVSNSSQSNSVVSNEEMLEKTVEGRERIVSSPASSSGISFPDEVVKDGGEMRQRRFQRANQVVKDRFDEWEEAYRLEYEQRKVDEMFMREALVEAKKAADSWEVPVGAVLVKGGKIISRGSNLVEELRDSTAHAEMICIREASNILRSWRLSDTTLYVTLEPCPMCAGAILQARIDTIVWGTPNKLLGADGSWIRLFPDGDGQRSTDKPPAPVHPFHPKMNVRRGVLANECAESMQQFFQRRRKKENKLEPPPPPSRIPLLSHPNKFIAKMHDTFHLMFCL
ncbi:unnamed protein product [Cuscuta epithymum]|uniref:tRNA(adenine(34)) deaminase n=1 Tax=Cuscuta epithymum TaxID=186058 RepID=A0AAV0F008_9ASTE|nr:unnamed protein product [Cuscuta epithymum]